jgi:PAS domain S-box-containing protein
MDKEIFIDCNEKTLKMFACTKEQIINKPPYKFSPEYQPDGRLSMQVAREKIGEALKGKSDTFEWKHKRYNGEEFDAEVSLNTFYHDEKVYIQAIVRDITERKRSEILLKNSEEKISNIYHNSKDIIMIIDKSKKIININKAVESQLGFKIPELIGKSPQFFIKDSDWKEVTVRVNELFKGAKIPAKEFNMISKKGEYIPFEGNSKLIKYEGKEAIISVIRNITERKEFEQRIFEVMIETEEKERQRLASDIHDEVGPLLSSLKMYIEMLNHKKDKQEYIKMKLQDLVIDTINNVREVSNALSSNLLINYGLDSAIKSFINKQKEIIQIDFKTNLNEKRFGIKIETVYYRIFKELVNNTLKHAQATKINIDLHYKDKNLVLKYTDDGIGFDMASLKKQKNKGLGLSNIANRVKTIYGEYSIISEKNKGLKFELKTKIK